MIFFSALTLFSQFLYNNETIMLKVFFSHDHINMYDKPAFLVNLNIYQRKCSGQLQIEEYLLAHQSIRIFDNWLAGHALK